MRLSKVKIGETKIIVKILGGENNHRLFEMGFVVGTKVRVVLLAPFNDPYLLSIRGYYLALNRSLVDLIIVED